MISRDGIFAVVFLSLAVLGLWFSHEASVRVANQRQCLTSYIASNATATKARSVAVTAESTATRRVISSGLSARNARDIVAARDSYFASLKMIDALRAANPVKSFLGCD